MNNKEEEYLDGWHQSLMAIRDFLSVSDSLPDGYDDLADYWESVTDTSVEAAQNVWDDDILEMIR